MKKFVLAFFGVLAVIGFVMADEFNANITKVEGNTVYFKKAGAGGKKAAPATEEKAEAAADAKILKGQVDAGPDAGKKGGKKGGAGGFAKADVKAGDPIDKGLKNDLFTKIDPAGKGVQARIITNDAGKITEIRAVPPKGGNP